MKEFNGGLIQNEEITLTEADEQESSHISVSKTEDSEGITDSRCSSCLKMISFGQYRTPLYYKKKDSLSSIFGGLVSIAVVVFMFIFALVTLVPIF